MAGMLSHSTSGGAWAATLAMALACAFAAGLVLPRPAHAQDDLAAVCAAHPVGPAAECHLAASAVRLIHPRVGTALWGGSPVPGSASTLGMRLGSLPRFSVSGRVVMLPMELPPLADRGVTEGSRALTGGVSAQVTLGILPGWSPLPTVGGFLSLDGVARGSWLHLPRGQGFEDGGVLGGSLGLRLGVLRESFTLPGVSVTGAYGRSTGFAFGDPVGAGDGGHIDGAVENWSLTGAVTRRVGPVRLTGGAALDRYTGDVELSYRGQPPPERVAAATDRWSAFGNVSWTLLVMHAVLEAGWQESPMPAGLPESITVDPTGWWAGLALRLSI